MIGNGEAETRAVAGAVKAAVDQVHLDAGVNITGMLVDLDAADDLDSRQYFMCWLLTSVLGSSLAEIVPPAVVRSVVNSKKAALPYLAPPNRGPRCAGSPPAARPASTTEQPPGRSQPADRDLDTFLWWLSVPLLFEHRWFARHTISPVFHEPQYLPFSTSHNISRFPRAKNTCWATDTPRRVSALGSARVSTTSDTILAWTMAELPWATAMSAQDYNADGFAAATGNDGSCGVTGTIASTIDRSPV